MMSKSQFSLKDLIQYFLLESGFLYCKDIDGLMTALNISHNTDQWRLFTDASKTKLYIVQRQCFAICRHAGHMKKSMLKHETAAEVYIV